MKKKAALCFFGQLRNLENGYSFTKPNVLDTNESEWEIDIFMHTWFEKDTFGRAFSGWMGVTSAPVNSDILNKVYEFYNPKKLLLEKQIKFDEKNFGSRSSSRVIVNDLISRCHSIKKTNELKKQYEMENNFTYDLVHYMRTDYANKSKINYNEFDLSFCNVGPWGYTNGVGVEDGQGIMNSTFANIYALEIDGLEQYWNSGTLFNSEHLLHRHLDESKIPIIRTKLLENIEILRK